MQAALLAVATVIVAVVAVVIASVVKVVGAVVVAMVVKSTTALSPFAETFKCGSAL